MNRGIFCCTLTIFFLVFLSAAWAQAGYSYAGLDGVILSNDNVWYYEEMDPLGRPSEAIRWENGKISEETSWVYHGDSQKVLRSVITGRKHIIETEYDLHGNILFVRETEKQESGDNTTEQENRVPDEKIIRYTYDERNRLRKSVKTEGDVLVATHFEYRDDGSLAEKMVFRNGSLSLRTVYRDEENWTETVYHDEQPLLTVVFEDGQRKRMQYETW